ncbi:MAG TPA: hypothetical protein VGF53_02520 [Pseudolabrys sp.]|jgi:hypothetical protein
MKALASQIGGLTFLFGGFTAILGVLIFFGRVARLDDVRWDGVQKLNDEFLTLPLGVTVSVLGLVISLIGVLIAGRFYESK